MVIHRLNRTWRKSRRRLVLITILAAWTCAGVGQADSPAGTTPAAQANPAVKPAAPATKTPAGTSSARVATKLAKKATAKRASAKPAGEKQPKPTPKQAGGVAARRDPFRLPPPPSPTGQQAGGGPGIGPLPPGTRGLVIGQLKLEGIVRQDTSNTMLTVVGNNTNRAYFLRENDAVYNGVVSKITPDSVYFKENFLDSYGRASSREVVKRMGQAPGEGR